MNEWSLSADSLCVGSPLFVLTMARHACLYTVYMVPQLCKPVPHASDGTVVAGKQLVDIIMQVVVDAGL